MVSAKCVQETMVLCANPTSSNMLIRYANKYNANKYNDGILQEMLETEFYFKINNVKSLALQNAATATSLYSLRTC